MCFRRIVFRFFLKKKMEAKIDLLFQLYLCFGKSDYLGEPVSQEEHALQCGQLALSEKKDDDEFIMAALFHDIGHLAGHWLGLPTMDYVGVMNHEEIGATMMKKLGATDRVCDLIGHHVDAKRYLRYKNTSYPLSSGSAESLKRQGGPMTKEEASQYESDKRINDYLLLRSFEDRGKVPGLKTLTWEKYRSVLKRVFSLKK